MASERTPVIGFDFLVADSRAVSSLSLKLKIFIPLNGIRIKKSLKNPHKSYWGFSGFCGVVGANLSFRFTKVRLGPKVPAG